MNIKIPDNLIFQGLQLTCSAVLFDDTDKIWSASITKDAIFGSTYHSRGITAQEALDNVIKSMRGESNES